MVDYDWAGYVTEPQILFSYTESDVKLSSTHFRLRYARDIGVGPSGAIGLFGGVEYQKIKQDVVGMKDGELI